jgi:hypothetical protein
MAQQAGTEGGAGALRGEDGTQVQGFLDRFARALTSADIGALAEMWQTPSLVVGDHDLRVVGSSDEVKTFFGSAKAQYNARGIADTRADVLRLDWITDRIAMVRVRWPYLDSGGRELGEEISTYTLRRDDDGKLRICVAVMHGATTRH